MDYKKQTVQGTNIVWYDKEGFRISFVDPSEGNSDYQQYLAWLAEGNEPEIVQP